MCVMLCNGRSECTVFMFIRVYAHSRLLFTLLDLCVSSLRRSHANLLCIVPILTDDPRRESLAAGVLLRRSPPSVDPNGQPACVYMIYIYIYIYIYYMNPSLIRDHVTFVCSLAAGPSDEGVESDLI